MSSTENKLTGAEREIALDIFRTAFPVLAANCQPLEIEMAAQKAAAAIVVGVIALRAVSGSTQ